MAFATMALARRCSKDSIWCLVSLSLTPRPPAVRGWSCRVVERTRCRDVAQRAASVTDNVPLRLIDAVGDDELLQAQVNVVVDGQLCPVALGGQIPRAPHARQTVAVSDV